MAAKAGVAYVDIRGDFSALNRDLSKPDSSLRRKFGTFGKLAGAGIVAGVGGAALVIKETAESAVDLGEQVNKTNVVFRGSEKTILRWSKSTSGALGISRREALEATGVFGNMLVPMGFARKEAGSMSKRMCAARRRHGELQQRQP